MAPSPFLFTLRQAAALLLIALLVAHPALAADDKPKVTIYRNEACGHCDMYLMELKYWLDGKGITDIEEKLMINNPEVRREISGLNQRLAIPFEMQGHMIVLIGERLVLEGHLPVSKLEQLVALYPNYDFPQLVLYQDSMETEEKLESYKALHNGQVMACDIQKPIADCIQEGKGKLGQSALLPLVVVGGLVDSFNPCAFGVMLFFIALLFTLGRARKDLLKIGLVYISMIFLTYFLIGIGILQAIMLTNVPHLFAKISGVAIILLGLVNIKDYFWYGRWFSLGIPAGQTARMKALMQKATLPSVVALGFLVGLCEFPCSGGVYVGILSLLAIETTYLPGLAYLLLYNVLFVLPLFAILLLANNPRTVQKMQQWHGKDKRYLKLVSGAVMVLLGAIALLLA
ncbi:MAG: hypothetical protein HY519_02775 [Candidatus Aenigmarchaeota archaeon]|nr:hypothetical protein [Candidatus Aenigmarchaeota archaeon]